MFTCLSCCFSYASLAFRRIIGFYLVLRGFTGFYLDLLSFTVFYCVLLGFTGFYWVLLGFTRFLLGITGFYWVSQLNWLEETREKVARATGVTTPHRTTGAVCVRSSSLSLCFFGFASFRVVFFLGSIEIFFYSRATWRRQTSGGPPGDRMRNFVLEFRNN